MGEHLYSRLILAINIPPIRIMFSAAASQIIALHAYTTLSYTKWNIVHLQMIKLVCQ